MKTFPKISIVTVNFNQGEFLEACIQSVLGQNYPNLEYIIIDGGSTDNSVEIIEKYSSQLTYWVSEPDENQYDGVCKGLNKCTGEIMAWINSDDRYHPQAFFAVAEIFTTFPQVRWLMGYPTEFGKPGFGVMRIRRPSVRWSRLRYLTYDFQFIQQESTFWRKSLWEEAGGGPDKNISLAGDLDLWARYFRTAQMYTTTALLGGFRYRGADQRSRAQMEEYLSQAKKIIDRERKQLSVMKRVGLSLLRVFGFLPGLYYFYGVPLMRLFYPWIYRLPPIIQYDFYAEKFVLDNYEVEHPPMYLFGKQVSLRK